MAKRRLPKYTRRYNAMPLFYSTPLHFLHASFFWRHFAHIRATADTFISLHNPIVFRSGETRGKDMKYVREISRATQHIANSFAICTLRIPSLESAFYAEIDACSAGIVQLRHWIYFAAKGRGSSAQGAEKNGC